MLVVVLAGILAIANSADLSLGSAQQIIYHAQIQILYSRIETECPKTAKHKPDKTLIGTDLAMLKLQYDELAKTLQSCLKQKLAQGTPPEGKYLELLLYQVLIYKYGIKLPCTTI